MTAQNGVGGSSAFFRQPEADPLILKEMNKPPHVLEYSLSESRPLSGPCRACTGEGIGER